MTQAVADTIAPQVSLTLPPQLSGRLPVAPQVSDNMAVDRVVFSLNGVPKWTDYSAPFEWPLDTSSLPDGIYTLTLSAFDAAGNRTDVTRTAAVGNRFAAELSPVRVDITTPAPAGDPVYGTVPVVAILTHRDHLPITYAELRINGVLRHVVDYAAAAAAAGAGSGAKDRAYPPSYTVTVSQILRYAMDTTAILAGQEIVIQVSARDGAGNTGVGSVRVTRAADPSPQWAITRAVTREGNRFRVTLRVRNTGTAPAGAASAVLVRDISHGYLGICTARTPVYDASRTEVACELSAESVSAGGEVTLSYELIPAMFDSETGSSPDYGIGNRTEISYVTAAGAPGSVVLRQPNIPGDYTSPPYPLVPSQVGEVFRLIDYVMVTDPAKLVELYGQDSANQVLQTMAVLAMHRNAVPALRLGTPAWTSAYRVRNNLQPDGVWGARMALDKLYNAYLLLVGGHNIVPSFTYTGIRANFNGIGWITAIRNTDFPYANIHSNEWPELKVGRIIGNTARDLIDTMQASSGVVIGRFVWDRSHAAGISGPEGTWEVFVSETDRLAGILRSQGMTVETVHTEYHTTEVDLDRLGPGRQHPRAGAAGSRRAGEREPQLVELRGGRRHLHARRVGARPQRKPA